MAELEFIVGIDIGTTFSSVSCHKSTVNPSNALGADKNHAVPTAYIMPEDLIHINRWPDDVSDPKRPKCEVPSAILVNVETREVITGWTVPFKQRLPTEKETYIHLQNIKLLLDGRDRQRLPKETLLKSLRKTGYTLQDVLSKYLRYLLDHTKSQLTKNHGYSAASSVQLIATVPAIWDGHADDIVVNCLESVAQDLEFGHWKDVFLVSEPDAAATYFCHAKGLNDAFLDVSIIARISVSRN